MIAGDDYNTKDVKKAVKEFQKKYNKSIVGLETTDISFKIKKSNI